LLDGWIAERVHCLGGLMHSFKKKNDNIRSQQLLGSRIGNSLPLGCQFLIMNMIFGQTQIELIHPTKWMN
jgi:hypothetical protein